MMTLHFLNDVANDAESTQNNTSLHILFAEAETCTPHHTENITLMFTAPRTMFYMGEVEYRLQR